MTYLVLYSLVPILPIISAPTCSLYSSYIVSLWCSSNILSMLFLEGIDIFCSRSDKLFPRCLDFLPYSPTLGLYSYATPVGIALAILLIIKTMSPHSRSQFPECFLIPDCVSYTYILRLGN